MTSFAFFSGVNVSQSLNGFETGYLGRGAVIQGSINASGDNIDVRIHGEILSTVPVSMGGSNLTLYVGATGIVESLQSSSTQYAAIEFLVTSISPDATGRLYNAGQITGGGMAIYASVFEGGDVAFIQNTGTIHAEDSAILTLGTGLLRVENSGLISGTTNGVTNEMTIFSASNTAILVLNRGVISGGVASIRSGAQADFVDNHGGTLVGSVLMGNGADKLDNGGGLVQGDVRLDLGDDLYLGNTGHVTGTVFGEDGNDTMVGNASGIDNFDGGLGTDTLDFRTGPGVVVALDLSFETDGAAAGDSFTGFEAVIGSAGSADNIRGNDASNTLIGLGGRDSLDGAGGADVLRGGNGIDTVTGGLGNDNFRFQSLGECGDVITDYHNDSGDNDRFQILASAFGGGLVAGALSATAFQARTDNVAQDAAQRFIFRTTDQTLWFDADGNLSAQAVMVADLQSGILLSALDILLI